MSMMRNVFYGVLMVSGVIVGGSGLSKLVTWFEPQDEVAPVVVEQTPKLPEVVKKAPKKMSAKEKKERFYALVAPHVKKVHAELMERYHRVEADLKAGKKTQEIADLKKRYKARSDKELLLALKPHPQSIVLAQAVLESSWGTSRLFYEANNIFGMKSHHANEPRIATNGNRVWFKKFETLEDSVRAYYKIIAKRQEYKEFREARFLLDDPFEMIQKLNTYAEIGSKYPQELARLMRHNKLQKYDD